MRSDSHYLRNAMKYSLLPGILPRIGELFSSGFSYLSFFMAQIYGAMRLLPPGHPYLLYSNKGRFGLWNVMGEARRHLVFKWSHIDQIFVFACLVIGIILLILQIAMLALSFVIGTASAAGPYWARFFVREDIENDIAFVTLDRVFGIPGIFNSHVSTGTTEPFPSAFHTGLQELFQYYSIGVFAIAIIIILYYVVTIVAETAVSGSPFGRRFNGLWAPVRLMLAIGLLAPISHGMNVAQLSTLRVAKWGSNLASNAWTEFNSAIEEASALGDPQSLIAIPSTPSANNYLEWSLVAHTCAAMYDMMYGRTIEPYIVRTRYPGGGATGADAVLFEGTSYQDAREFNNFDTITIVFGEQHEDHVNHPAQVEPVCGILSFHVLDIEEEGAVALQQSYYELLQSEWFNWSDMRNYGRSIAERFSPTLEKDPNATLPSTTYLHDGIKTYHENMYRSAISAARETQQRDSDWQERREELGWAGAGMWYNKVAQYNGTLFAAVFNLPTPVAYPMVMEYTRQQRVAMEEQVHPRDRYRPYRSDNDPDNPGAPIEYETQGEFYIAQALYFAQSLWEDSYISSTQNPILDFINLIFGTTGLFNMRENIDAGVHPLAAIVGIGSSLIESTILNVGAFTMGGILGGGGQLASSTVATTIGKAITSVSFQLAMLAMTLGFMLFYILPFLPFIYFFFAFCGWLKAVFEAMVGLPLWALAFLRIDGEGPTGAAALDGLFLVFEIFFRPIVILIALISSVTIFSAMVNVLNNIWDLVLTNLVGHRPPLTDGPEATAMTMTGIIEAARGTVDYLFYTVIYAIFVYLLAVSSFKMVDLVPNYTLRWMGKSINTAGEGELSNSADGMMGSLFMGTQMMADTFSKNSIIGGLMGRN